MTQNEKAIEAEVVDNEPKDMVWLIGYMRDLIAKEIESEIEEILKKETDPNKLSLKLRSKIEGLQRAAEISRER